SMHDGNAARKSGKSRRSIDGLIILRRLDNGIRVPFEVFEHFGLVYKKKNILFFIFQIIQAISFEKTIILNFAIFTFRGGVIILLA
ncbi:MAG: hypothetical protein LUH54_04835, partial [Firmicutes bacterium]|nr:hypothetical protein [Bacillota bacterium]